jgi:hypothetical protein
MMGMGKVVHERRRKGKGCAAKRGIKREDGNLVESKHCDSSRATCLALKVY